MRKPLLALSLLLAFPLAGGQCGEELTERLVHMPRVFAEVFQPEQTPPVADEEWVLRYAGVTPGPALHDPSTIAVGDTLAIELFDREGVLARITRTDIVAGHWNVRADIITEPGGTVLLTLRPNRGSGSIQLGDRQVYHLRYDSRAHMHVLMRVDPARLDELPGDPPEEVPPY